MRTDLEGKHGRRDAFEMGVLGGVGGLRPRLELSAQPKGATWANQFAGSYTLYTHMIAQRRKAMRGKAVDRRN